jgi:hypothetical protein
MTFADLLVLTGAVAVIGGLWQALGVGPASMATGVVLLWTARETYRGNQHE